MLREYRIPIGVIFFLFGAALPAWADITVRGTVYYWNGDSGTLRPLQIVAAGLHRNTCWRTDGSVWAWGYNGWGQLGDGTTEQRLVPVKVQGLPGKVAAVAASGSGTSFALGADGAVWEWGHRERPDDWHHGNNDTRVPQRIAGLAEIAFSILPFRLF